MPPQEVFLSHASADAAFATALAEVLRDHGIPVWYSRTDIRGAQVWHDEIGRALKRCDWFVVVLSPAAVASMWVRRELRRALEDPRLSDGIASVYLGDCDIESLSWVLPQYQSVDFRIDVEEGYRELLRIWGVGYRGRAG